MSSAPQSSSKPRAQPIAQQEVTGVQIEEVAVMKILKHARESREAHVVAQLGRQSYTQNQAYLDEERNTWTIGRLLGYYHNTGDRKGTLEVSNNYPTLLYPATTEARDEQSIEDQRQEERRYDEEVSRRLPEVSLESNSVGLYHISYRSNNLTKEFSCIVEYLEQLTQRNPATVYLVYDFQEHLAGAAQPLRAYQLSAAARELVTKDGLTVDDFARATFADLFKPVPVEVRFSPLSELFLKAHRDALARPYLPALLNPNRQTGSGQEQSAVSASGPGARSAAARAAAARSSKANVAQDDSKGQNAEVFDFYALKAKNYTYLDEALKRHYESCHFKFEEQYDQKPPKDLTNTLKTGARVHEIADRIEYLGDFVQQCDSLAEELGRLAAQKQ